MFADAFSPPGASNALFTHPRLARHEQTPCTAIITEAATSSRLHSASLPHIHAPPPTSVSSCLIHPAHLLPVDEQCHKTIRSCPSSWTPPLDRPSGLPSVPPSPSVLSRSSKHLPLTTSPNDPRPSLLDPRSSIPPIVAGFPPAKERD